MIGWTVDAFVRIDRVKSATTAAARKWLHRVGGYTRVTARRLLKRARPMRSVDELSDDQLDRWVMMNQIRGRRGLEPADLPERVSKPGQPPLLHQTNSPLKRLLNYAVDLDGLQVVIGTERARSGIAHKLEHGSGRILPRPFMAPAEAATRPRMAQWWHNAIT